MTPAPIDRRTFLKNLQASGLMPPRDLKALLKRLPLTNRGRSVARFLVTEGLLTKFQAELLLAGRTSGFLLGQYRILEPIGQGGMGRVFKAVHQTMNRVVALKVLAPQQMNTERARELFKREVRAAGHLMHPNVVTAYDASCAEGRHYLAMEYVDGPNLERLVKDRGPLPAGLACEIVRQAANGLQYAHEMGMVHRDIKPGNLLAQHGPTPLSPLVVKILDFGLARLQPAVAGMRSEGTILTVDNTVMGTPDYLSPEQSRNLHRVDIRADLYSLGCTFYYLLTGQVPFPGGTSLEKLVRHTAEEATPLEAYRPDLPAAVAAVVRRLMAKDAADRYQTPAELAAALAPLATAGPAEWVMTPAETLSGFDTGSPTPRSIPLAPRAGAAAGVDATAERVLDVAAYSLTTEDLPTTPPALEERSAGLKKVLLWGVGLAAVGAGLLAVLLPRL